MQASPSQELLTLVARTFGTAGPLAETEHRALRDCMAQVRSTPAGAALAGGAQLIVSGWVGAFSDLPDGRRQMSALHLPGDLIGFGGGEGDGEFHAVALTAVKALSCEGVEHAIFAGRAPNLARVLAARAHRENTLLLRHIVRIARLSALPRTANWILEVQQRLQRVGLADARQMPWRLTQVQLASLLGLSEVHMNRVLQTLRRQRLIRSRRGAMVVLDAQRLAELGNIAVADQRRVVESGTAPSRRPLVSAPVRDPHPPSPRLSPRRFEAPPGRPDIGRGPAQGVEAEPG